MFMFPTYLLSSFPKTRGIFISIGWLILINSLIVFNSYSGSHFKALVLNMERSERFAEQNNSKYGHFLRCVN